MERRHRSSSFYFWPFSPRRQQHPFCQHLPTPLAEMMVIELRKSTSRVQENLLKESETGGYNDDNSGVKLEDDDDWVWDNDDDGVYEDGDDDGVEEINIEISFFSSARRSPLCSDGLRVTCANRALLALKLSTFINYFCFSCLSFCCSLLYFCYLFLYF